MNLVLERRLVNKAEYFFVLFSICFFLGVFSFESLFIPSEASTLVFLGHNFLAPILSLIQHLIFLITAVFSLISWQSILSSSLSRKIPLTLFVLLCLSFLWSDMPNETLMRSVSLFETIFFGIYFGSCFSIYQQIRILRLAFCAAVVLSILLSIGLPIAGIEAGIHAGAWRGIFAHKNYLAREMALGALVARAITIRNRQDRYLSLFLLIASFFLVLMSDSKTGLFILFAALAFFEAAKTLRLDIGFVLLTWLSSTFVLSISGVIIVSNFEAIVTSFGRDPTISGRTIIWGALVDKIQVRPLLGYGYEGFWRGIYGESEIIGKIITSYIPPHAHNGLFDLTIAFGLIGLTLFLASLISLIRRSILLARNTQVSEGVWPLCYAVFIVLYNQTESTLVEHNSIFWIVLVSVIMSNFSECVRSGKSLKGFQGISEDLKSESVKV